HGYDVLTYNTDGLPAKERKCLGRLLEGRVDGVIGVFFHLTARDLRPLLERKIAIVRIEASPKKVGPWPLDNLFVDNVSGAKAATQYLIERGHRRIVMIAGTGGPECNRVSGYLQALDEMGLTPQLASHGDFNEEGGYLATRDILATGARPTAIFAARFVTPPLSTINMFQCKLGRVAAEMVIERLNELPPEASGRQRQMPFEVVRRQSA